MNYRSLCTCKRKNVCLLLMVLGTVLVVYYQYGNIQHQQLLFISSHYVNERVTKKYSSSNSILKIVENLNASAVGWITTTTQGYTDEKKELFNITTQAFDLTTLVNQRDNKTAVSDQIVINIDMLNQTDEEENGFNMAIESLGLTTLINETDNETGLSHQSFFSNDMQKSSLVQDVEGITPTFAIPIPTEEPSFVPGIGRCEGCLAGRQLISVHPSWICGGPRIGNKMFMLASAISLADSWNATFVLPKPNKSCQWMEWLQDIFCTITSTVPLLPAHVMKKWPYFGESTFSEFRLPDRASSNLTITGFKQSWKYFQQTSNWEAVKKMFRFSEKYKLIAERNLNMAKAQFNITDPLFVGVHIRLGDLISYRFHNSYGYVVANSSFYELAFETAEQYLSGKNGSIIFVVASDTLDVAKQMLEDLNEFYDIFFTHGSAFEDLTSLCTCNHSIISGGTYGFWAAKLAGGLTFYHPYFARPGSQFDKDFHRDNFYLPEWIPVYWEPAIDTKFH